LLNLLNLIYTISISSLLNVRPTHLAHGYSLLLSYGIFGSPLARSTLDTRSISLPTLACSESSLRAGLLGQIASAGGTKSRNGYLYVLEDLGDLSRHVHLGV
jgi:hypothetical protein